MKKLLVMLLGILLVASSAAAVEVGGVNLPDMMKAGSDNLILNGAGIRTKWMMDIYAGGLYLTQKNMDAQAIIDDEKQPMAIKLHMISGLITSEKMMKACKEGFEKSTKGNVAPIQAKVDKFINVFLEEIKKGDIYDLVYVPAQGTVIYKNGKQKAVIEGADFKKPLFGIWLCDQPAHEKLKEGMLGL